MAKKTVTQNEKLQLLGLLTLGIQHQKVVQQVEKAIADITETEVGDSQLGEAIYEADTDIDKLLGYMGIEVEDAAA